MALDEDNLIRISLKNKAMSTFLSIGIPLVSVGAFIGIVLSLEEGDILSKIKQ